MKTAVVPAQVTTVEDKIAGNLNLTQLILIVTPVFVGGGLYVILPPSFELMAYKIVMMTIIFCLFTLLAIRINDRLLINWIVILVRYNTRPKYYVLDKNDPYLRESTLRKETITNMSARKEINGRPVTQIKTMDIAERTHYEQLIAHPDTNLVVSTNKKGHLHVTISKI